MFTTEEGGIVITDLKVSKEGKIYLRERAVERHGIEVGDVLAMTIYPDGMDKVMFGRRRVGTQDRITVPDEYGGLEGSIIDLVINDVISDSQ